MKVVILAGRWIANVFQLLVAVIESFVEMRIFHENESVFVARPTKH